ncbi:transposase, partial [Leptospira interrogans]
LAISLTMNRSIGSQSFRIAKSILNKGVQVIVLNPGNLATIYQSLKKTDKEDSLKIARLIQRHPIEELPTVPIPNDEEEDNRRLCSEHENWTKQLTQGKNRLHSLFTQADYFFGDQSKLNISLPMGRSISYMGDCKRFSSAKQAAYYAGLVPRVDISGDTVRYGRIINRGCHSIRRVIVQAAWSLVRCQHGGKVKEFYQRLYLKKGAKKSIIATSRKMIEVLYVMIRTGKLFDSMPEVLGGWWKGLENFSLSEKYTFCK